MGKTLTIDLEKVHVWADDKHLGECLERMCRECEATDIVKPAPSREEELLTLIKRFWKIAERPDYASWKVLKERGQIEIWGNSGGPALAHVMISKYLPNWATSDDAAEEAAKVAVRKWIGLRILKDVAGGWFAQVFGHNGHDTPFLWGASRGEAALRAVIAASEKWKD